MSWTREAWISVYAAYGLARGNGQAIHLFEASIDGFWRSFSAAFILLPFHLLLFSLEATSREIHWLRYLLLQLDAYALAWLIFPLVMVYMTRLLDRRQFYLRYIVAYNWAAVIQAALYLPVGLLREAGFLTPELTFLFSLIVLSLLLLYGWFIAKVGLSVSSATAAGIVLLDYLLGVILNGYFEFTALR